MSSPRTCREVEVRVHLHSNRQLGEWPCCWVLRRTVRPLVVVIKPSSSKLSLSICAELWSSGKYFTVQYEKSPVIGRVWKPLPPPPLSSSTFRK